jgi:uridine phosphorylase
MRSENINHEYLDPVVRGESTDVYYHLGVSSADPLLTELREVRAVVLAGSGERILGLSERWSAEHGDAPIRAFPKGDRFVTRYCQGVLFVSHGMGMASASIAMQELMRLIYLLKSGDVDALDQVLWVRVGTCGGIGLAPGTVVVTSEAVMIDLRPFRVLHASGGEMWFDGRFPSGEVDAIVGLARASAMPVEVGRTVSGNEFFLEQFRRDGAIIKETAETRDEWLRRFHDHGVRSFEMEGAMIAGYLNHWGFPRFAMVCAALLDRLEGDQVTASAQELDGYAQRAGAVVLDYLRSRNAPAASSG